MSSGRGGGGGDGDDDHRSGREITSSSTQRNQPDRLNRSTETSLMTFNLAPSGRSNNPASNNNPSTHNYISLSMLDGPGGSTGGGGGGVSTGGGGLSTQAHPRSLASNDDVESNVIDVDSVSIANPLMTAQQSTSTASQHRHQHSLPSLSSNKSKKHSKQSKRKQQQQQSREREQQQQQQLLQQQATVHSQSQSGRFNRQFSIPSYISNAYSDRISLKSLYFINNQTVNSSILTSAAATAAAVAANPHNSSIKKSNKVGKIIQLDQPD